MTNVVAVPVIAVVSVPLEVLVVPLAVVAVPLAVVAVPLAVRLAVPPAVAVVLVVAVVALMVVAAVAVVAAVLVVDTPEAIRAIPRLHAAIVVAAGPLVAEAQPLVPLVAHSSAGVYRDPL